MAEEAPIGRLEVVRDAVIGAPRHLEHAEECLLKLAVLVVQRAQLCQLKRREEDWVGGRCVHTVANQSTIFHALIVTHPVP